MLVHFFFFFYKKKLWDRDGEETKLNRVKEKQINSALLQKLKGFGNQNLVIHLKSVRVVIRSSGFGYFKTVNAPQCTILLPFCAVLQSFICSWV